MRNPLPPLFRTIGVVPDLDRLDRLPDDALLAAVALDESHAAVVFVRRFQGRVFGLACTIVGDRVLAEDIAQQAFERAWRHAGSYDGRRAAVSTWLLTITRNLAIDAIRVRRSVPVDPWTMADLLVPSTLDPAALATQSDEMRRVRLALEALPDEQRRAVVLATIGGRTSAEIGEIESVPTPTAKTRLRTGLRRLRETMANEVER